MKIKREICARQILNNPQEFEFELTKEEMALAAKEYNHLLNCNAVKTACEKSITDNRWYQNMSDKDKDLFLSCAAKHLGICIKDNSIRNPWIAAIDIAKLELNI